MRTLRSALQIGTPIGAGYFGHVFRGEDPVHGVVAVKIPRQRPEETAEDWTVRKAELLGEGQRLKAATHANVVQVFHLLESEEDDSLILVMEHCNGGSLQAPFDAGPMKINELRKIITDATFGIQALHNRGMLHRDVKPSNILLDGGIAKIADFGLVTDRILLGYGSLAGYSNHIAPEVWETQLTTIRSDIWALGMTIFRLLHGARWYARCAASRAVVADGNYSDSLLWLPHITKKWRRLVRSMLHDDADRRPRNGGAVLGALANLETEPAWRCQVGAEEVCWEIERRSRRTIVLWRKQNSGRYTWEARSEPLGAGNRRSLGGSQRELSYANSERELRLFFSNFRPFYSPLASGAKYMGRS